MNLEAKRYNLYIDTCSYVNLLQESKRQMLIANLEYWIESKQATIFTNEIIIDEWDRKKEDVRLREHQSQRAKLKNFNEVGQRVNLKIPDVLSLENDVDSAIETIDKILRAAHKFTEPSSTTKGRLADRVRKRHPPFHNKVDSMNDAYIIFSALEYFEERGEDFIFVSENKHDFADESNENLLHTHITSEYGSIRAIYFNKIGLALHELKQVLSSPELSHAKDIREHGLKYVDGWKVDSNAPLVDKVLSYLEFMHRELNFLPSEIILNHYPFIANRHDYVYHNYLSAEIRNEQLFAAFKQLSISDVDTDVIKKERIFELLSNDLIWELSCAGDTLNLRQKRADSICECVICQIQRFQLDNAQELLSQAPLSLNDTIVHAYAHYLLDDFIASETLSLKALKLAHSENATVTEFICFFNLTKISRFLANWFFYEPEIRERVKQYDDTALQIYRARASKNFDATIIDYIHGNRFYNEAIEEVRELHIKIVDNYYAHLQGGWSTNDHTSSIIKIYVKLRYFLNQNRIVYDAFTEFKSLADQVFEALFASHGIAENSGSRLEHFDTWLIHQMLLFADPKRLNKHYARYGHSGKRIKFVENASKGDQFENLISNFFSTAVIFVSDETERTRRANHRINRQFCNFLVLVSFLDVTGEFVDSVFSHLLKFLRSSKVIFPYNLDFVSGLIYRRGADISEGNLRALFDLVIEDNKYFGDDLLMTVSRQLKQRGVFVNLSHDQLHTLKRTFFQENTGTISNINGDVAVVLQILGNRERGDLVNTINSYLLVNFDISLFHRLCVYDIIPFDIGLYYKAVASLDEHTGKSLGVKDYRLSAANDLINLAFKFNIDTTDNRFMKVRALDPYYDWLCSMHSFDYNHFKPEWIGEYQTYHYFEIIRGSSNTRKAIEKYLSTNHDRRVQRLYLRIFIKAI